MRTDCTLQNTDIHLKMYRSVILLLMVYGVVTYGFQHFRYRIPNGEFVVHPCFKANVLWYGVGHKNPLGGGERNQFGLDFASQGHHWTRCLCEMDSDGDGITNGEELGDPYCTWSEGEVPHRVTGITHPGVCLPLNSYECVGHSEFVQCTDPTVFDCPAIQDAAVMTTTLAIPETAVPPVATSYKCMTFELPRDGDYHLIAASPTIDNDIVMHHIIVFGCRGEEEENNAKAQYPTPTDCHMTECKNIVTAWTLGIQGVCYGDEYGFRIGTSGFRVVVMEIHWNNPELQTSYTDATSLDLYYTPNKRAFDAGSLFVGPILLMIPPGFASYDVVGTCSGDCLGNIFNETWYLAELMPHMHYLGSGFKLEIIHNGVATTLYEELQYFYDNPQIHQFDDHVAVEPGDAIRVTCTYSSKSRGAYTYYGSATSDEMCYAILIYYPNVATEFTACEMNDNYGFCPIGNYTNLPEDCDSDDFFAIAGTSSSEIYLICDSTGKNCNPGCETVIEPLLAHPCMTSDASSLITAFILQYDVTFVQMLLSCGEKPTVVAGDRLISDEICPDEGSGISLHAQYYLLVFIAGVLTCFIQG